MDEEESRLWDLKREINKLRDQLDLVNACQPCNAVKIRKRLLEKLLEKKENEANELLRIDTNKFITW